MACGPLRVDHIPPLTHDYDDGHHLVEKQIVFLPPLASTRPLVAELFEHWWLNYLTRDRLRLRGRRAVQGLPPFPLRPDIMEHAFPFDHCLEQKWRR